MLTSTLYYVATHPHVKAKLFDEVDRFGRHNKVTFGDMDKFPYLEVRDAQRQGPCLWQQQPHVPAGAALHACAHYRCSCRAAPPPPGGAE